METQGTTKPKITAKQRKAITAFKKSMIWIDEYKFKLLRYMLDVSPINPKQAGWLFSDEVPADRLAAINPKLQPQVLKEFITEVQERVTIRQQLRDAAPRVAEIFNRLDSKTRFLLLAMNELEVLSGLNIEQFGDAFHKMRCATGKKVEQVYRAAKRAKDTDLEYVCKIYKQAEAIHAAG